jgi:hypothetical protein
MPAEGVSPRAGTQGPDSSLGTGYFADAKFRHDSEHVERKPVESCGGPHTRRYCAVQPPSIE